MFALSETDKFAGEVPAQQLHAGRAAAMHLEKFAQGSNLAKFSRPYSGVVQ